MLGDLVRLTVKRGRGAGHARPPGGSREELANGGIWTRVLCVRHDGAVWPGAEERHGRSRREAAWFQVWHYAHLPMFLGIAIAGAGFEKAISLRVTERLDYAANAVVCVAVAVLMGALVAIGAASQRGRHMARNCALVVPCLVLAASAGCWHRVAFAVTLVTACWILAASVKRHCPVEAV